MDYGYMSRAGAIGLLGFGCVTGFMIANSVAVEVRGGRILSVEASGRVQDAENMIRKVPKQSLATSRTTTAPAAALTDTPTSKEMGNCGHYGRCIQHANMQRNGPCTGRITIAKWALTNKPKQ